MYSQVVGTANDCSMLIDALPAKYPELSMSNGIGVCGISQGGHFALSMLVSDPRVDVCVALIGAGDYEQNMRVRFDNLLASSADRGGPAPVWEELWPAAMAAMTEKHDPIHNLDSFQDRP
jgi:pimeloyl-ACP methyl ester carboxylesterase